MENRVKLAVKAVQVFSFRSLCCSSCFLVFLEISSVFWGNTASIPELKESTNDKKIDGQCNGDTEATEPANISISHGR